MDKEFANALENIGKGQHWKTCFDWISPLSLDCIFLVSIGSRYMYYDWLIDRYLLDMTFDMAQPFQRNSINYEYTKVRNGDKYNILKIDGTFLLDEWVDWVGNTPKDGYWFVEKDNQWYVFDINGNWREKEMGEEIYLPDIK